MQYKTQRQDWIWVAVFIFVLSMGGIVEIASYRREGEYFLLYIELFIALCGGSLLAYCCTYDAKRNMYRKNGECFRGHIIGADYVTDRGEWTYYLKIEFYDNGRKIKYTEGYAGNPNLKLKSCECNIYKWKGKYMEADFRTLEKREKPLNLNIPTSRHKMGSKKKEYY